MRPLSADPGGRIGQASRRRPAVAVPAEGSARRSAAPARPAAVRGRAAGVRGNGRHAGALGRLWHGLVIRRRAAGRMMTVAGLVGLPVAIALAAVVADVPGLLRVQSAALWQQVQADAGLAVAEVTVVGRRDTPSDALLTALAVTRGEPILSVDTGELRRRVETLGWVRSASVHRMLPGRIHVELVERRPVAIWQDGEQFTLVDAEGKVIGPDHLSLYAHLPQIVGPEAPRHVGRLLNLYAREPDLARRVTAAVRVGERRWNLRIEDRIDVRLPEDGVENAWVRLAGLVRDHALLDRAIVSVDLRLPDRLVVKLTEEAARIRRPATGEDA